eukprot:c22505_g1_i3 orf=714-1787(-)
MGEWMGGRERLKRVVGLVKDQVALGRAIAKGGFVSLHVAIVTATNHDEKLPDEKSVKVVLSSRSGSRMHISYCVRVIMDRLNNTHNWAVAFKCLILIHRGLRDGGFVFQDRLCFLPARGGRNYLKLSNFKDVSSPFTWEISSWIRWYAVFLDHWIATCRVLGCFMDSKNKDSTVDVSSLSTEMLVTEISTLQDLLQEVCAVPVEGSVIENDLVRAAFRMVLLDNFKAQEQLKLRMGEVPERLTHLHKSEVFQLLRVCDKLAVQSMRLLYVMEVALSLNILPASECPAKILFTDYEIVNIKEALRAVSLQNIPVSSSLITASIGLVSSSRWSPFPRCRSSGICATMSDIGRSRNHDLL